MITAAQLYGRSNITAGQQAKLDAANKTARELYLKRDEEPFKDDLPENATLQDVEQLVLKVVRHVYK